MDLEKKTETTVRKRRNRKRIILWTLLGAVLLLLGIGAYYIYSVVARPRSLFEESVSATATPAAALTPAFDIEQYLPTQAPGAIETPSQAEVAVPQPETTGTATQPTSQSASNGQAFSGIVNIALFGIDAYEDGGTTSGTMPHTDANMIVAVNFDTKEVSLISIARDAFTNIPGRNGFYKFNGVFNVGGGLDDPKAGLELSCRTAEMWLGGMSVPYYFGVDFQAVIDLVDALGGIDFDLDIVLFGLDGEVLAKPGQQHLNGEQVLAYLRMRKHAGAQDWIRTGRQRKMMVALFQKLKEAGQLSMIPDLLKIMGDNVYTNTTVAQTAALASFAQGVDPSNIHTYSFQGTMHGGYDWRYCAVDQDERIQILKTVYGINAEPLGVNSTVYEQFLHKGGFLALQHLGYVRKLFEAIHSTVPVENMTEEQKRSYALCWKDYSDLQAAFDAASQWMEKHYDEKQELSVEERQERIDLYSALTTREEQLRDSGNKLNEAFGNPVELRWFRDIDDWYKPGSVINEVYVDFA